jgi:hypothetical protein
MARNIPFALDDLVISDGENWRSRLLDGFGLAGAQPVMASRYGRRPVFANAGLNAQERTLQTLWLTADHDERATRRALLMRMLNPDRRVTRRLTVVDSVIPGVAPDEVLLWLDGDVYYDADDAAWYLRDVLQPDDIEATIGGALHLETGAWAGTRALMVENDGKNYCKSPGMYDGNSDGVADSPWVDGGGTLNGTPTKTVVNHPISERGWMQRFEYTGVAGDSGQLYAFYIQTGSGTFSAGDDATMTVDIKGSTDAAALIQIRAIDSGGSVLGVAADSILATEISETVSRYELAYSNLPASTDYLQCRFYPAYLVDNGDDVNIYFGAVNIEKADYATSYMYGGLPWCSWSSTEHNSTSTRTKTEVNLDDYAARLSGNDTWTLSAWVQAPYDADADWPETTNYVLDTRGADNNNRVILRYNSTDDRWTVYINGADTISSGSTQTFSAGDWIHLVLTVDFASDEYKLYVDGTLYDSSTGSLSAPTLTDWKLLTSYTAIENFFNGALEEAALFDNVLTAEEVSVLHNASNLNPRWADVFCRAADAWQVRGRPSDKGLVSTLVLDRDARWRRRDGDLFGTTMTTDTDSLTVENLGDDLAYPIFYIEPKTAKSSGYAYKRFVAVTWRADAAATRYPVDIVNDGLDTASLVTASKMQADGDDLRVYNGGSEIDRWLQDINTSTTQVWCNLDFEAAVDMTLKTAITAGATVTTVEVNEDIGDMPSTGILMINSEVFTYTSKNDTDRRFLGVTRAAKGTSAAAHAVDDDVYWLQHDLWIWYGNASVSAPTVDDDYKPAFELDSTNTSWVYEEFGEDDGLRAGQWVTHSLVYSPSFYGGNRGASADPYVEVGIYVDDDAGTGVFYIENVCGVTNLNFTNGEQYADDTGRWYGKIVSWTGAGYQIEASIAAPSSDSTWESWSANQAITSDRVRAGLYYGVGLNSGDNYVEASDCTVTLDSSNTPVVSVGSEQGNYVLDLTIENETTGDELVLSLSMDLDEVLVVDTDAQTVTYLTESKIEALTLTGGVRLDWLALEPGENALAFEDTATQELDVWVVFDRRLFE